MSKFMDDYAAKAEFITGRPYPPAPAPANEEGGSTVVETEFGIEWPDEVEFGYDSIESARDHLADCFAYYEKESLDLDAIEGARVIQRRVTTIRSDWWSGDEEG